MPDRPVLPSTAGGNGPRPAALEPDRLTANEIQREVRDVARRRERRRRMAPRAALVGIVAGLLAAAFRVTLDLCDRGRDALFRFAHSLPAPLGFCLAVALCGMAAGAALWLVRRFAPETAGSGIPHIKAVLHRLRGMKWKRVLLVKFASGTLGLSAGLALGREGPTVQMGGAVGQMVSRWFHARPRERHTLVAAGAGAGLAAAFNAPLAGVIFVLEELRRDFAPGALTAAFIASVSADVIARFLLGQEPVFKVAGSPVPPLESLPLFLVLGLLAGAVGVAFNRSLLGSLRLFERTSRWKVPVGLPAALVGMLIGAIGWFAPELLGGGGKLVETTLTTRWALAPLLVYLLLRFGMTMLSYGTGTAGGIFAPLLVIGAQAGLLLGLLGQRIWPGAGAPSTFAVVGMGALFAAIVRAPLTGIVLILEMTENYQLMLPLLAACFTAYAVADLLRDEPIYEALLERDLLRSQGRVEGPGEAVMIELRIEEDSPFDGRRVGELGLPPGCLLVTVERHGQSLIPTRDTLLHADDQLTAVVAANAQGAAELLHHGVAKHAHEV